MILNKIKYLLCFYILNTTTRNDYVKIYNVYIFMLVVHYFHICVCNGRTLRTRFFYVVFFLFFVCYFSTFREINA